MFNSVFTFIKIIIIGYSVVYSQIESSSFVSVLVGSKHSCIFVLVFFASWWKIAPDLSTVLWCGSLWSSTVLIVFFRDVDLKVGSTCWPSLSSAFLCCESEYTHSYQFFLLLSHQHQLSNISVSHMVLLFLLQVKYLSTGMPKSVTFFS